MHALNVLPWLLSACINCLYTSRILMTQIWFTCPCNVHTCFNINFLKCRKFEDISLTGKRMIQGRNHQTLTHAGKENIVLLSPAVVCPISGDKCTTQTHNYFSFTIWICWNKVSPSRPPLCPIAQYSCSLGNGLLCLCQESSV